jgi:ankyrin repeat protein
LDCSEKCYCLDYCPFLNKLEMCADSEGRTPLHWAVDRGHLNVTELLVGRNADVNAKVFINTSF